jgi:methionine synthase II (cobalamin-independent)
MIKNFDEFVNGNEQITEGKFFDNVISGIEAGVAAFKAKKHMNKEIENDNEKLTVSKLLDDTKEYDKDTQLAVLVDGLLNRAVMLAEFFTRKRPEGTDTEHVHEYMNYKIEKLETILAAMKELLKKQEQE